MKAVTVFIALLIVVCFFVSPSIGIMLACLALFCWFFYVLFFLGGRNGNMDFSNMNFVSVNYGFSVVAPVPVEDNLTYNRKARDEEIKRFVACTVDFGAVVSV